MGMQGLTSLRLKTPSGATCKYDNDAFHPATDVDIAVPLTTTWCELMGVDALFSLNRLDTARDQRISGIASVFLGMWFFSYASRYTC